MINNDYPLNTLNQLRPLLIGFSQGEWPDAKRPVRKVRRHSTDILTSGSQPLPVRALNGYSRCFPSSRKNQLLLGNHLFREEADGRNA